MSLTLDAIGALQQAVRHGPRVLPVGGGSKSALSTPPSDDVVLLDMSSLSGLTEYDAAELTFTALAGTPVAEVTAALADHGQYLPFDPPLGASGATVGGVVAAGTSGANAFRHGGVRDFVVGVSFIDGTGRLVAGGGKVVKNAAGFDLPKLMVGSMGRLGVIVQLSFKVFPRPRATTTLIFEVEDTASALGAMARLVRGPLVLDALDLDPPRRVLARMGGDGEGLAARAGRLAQAAALPVERLDGEQDDALWRDAAEFRWLPEGSHLIRVGLTARSVPGLEAALAAAGARARYSLGVNLAWVAWPGERALGDLDAALRSLRLAGMVLIGPPDRLLIGDVPGGVFAARIRSAIDPNGRFLEA